VRRLLKLDKGVVIACLVVAIGIAFVARGLLISVTGDDRANLPVAVESVNPVPEAEQTLSQTNVFVDLITGYTGELTINGITIDTRSLDDLAAANPQPGQQVQLPPVTIFEPGNSTLTFTPTAGAPIESFDEGLHTVKLSYWPLTEGRRAARTFTWTFTVV